MATVTDTITILQGATKIIRFNSVAEGGADFDGTGWLPFFQVRKNYADNAPAETDVLLTLESARWPYTAGSPGHWEAELTPTETRTLTEAYAVTGGHYYGFELENGGAQKLRAAQGRVTVTAEVAREQDDVD